MPNNMQAKLLRNSEVITWHEASKAGKKATIIL
jgi:hypothetical protein